MREKGRSRCILAVMAHYDDEVFFATRIAHHTAKGHRVVCVFTTNGDGGRATTLRRSAESRRALARLGVADDDVVELGRALSIPDGQSHDHAARIFSGMVSALADRDFDEIWTMAWEGGHVDHDVAHLVALTFGRRTHAETPLFEFAAYHSGHVPTPHFRVMRPLAREGLELRRLSWREGVDAFLLISCYRSQWRTWIGLAPDCFYRMVVRRQEWRRAVDVSTSPMVKRPHSGELLYERMFGVTFHSVEKSLSRFLEELRSIT